MNCKFKTRVGASLLMITSLGVGGLVEAQVLDSGQIQMLLDQAQEIESCMSSRDAAATEALRARSEQVTAQVQALCKTGKREEAQARALAFGREMADSPAMENLQNCSGPLGALLPAALASLNGDAADAVQVFDVH